LAPRSAETSADHNHETLSKSHCISQHVPEPVCSVSPLWVIPSRDLAEVCYVHSQITHQLGPQCYSSTLVAKRADRHPQPWRRAPADKTRRHVGYFSNRTGAWWRSCFEFITIFICLLGYKEILPAAILENGRDVLIRLPGYPGLDDMLWRQKTRER
jgi:hypothetical protein